MRDKGKICPYCQSTNTEGVMVEVYGGVWHCNNCGKGF